MVQIAITKVITTLNEAEAKFNLRRTEDDRFFTEWFEGLLELTDSEKTSLDRVKDRYRYHRDDGLLAEGAVNLIVVSPLLELAGFYDPPSSCGLKNRLKSPLKLKRNFYEDG